jgi:hypothetical protein
MTFVVGNTAKGCRVVSKWPGIANLAIARKANDIRSFGLRNGAHVFIMEALNNITIPALTPGSGVPVASRPILCPQALVASKSRSCGESRSTVTPVSVLRRWPLVTVSGQPPERAC